MLLITLASWLSLSADMIYSIGIKLCTIPKKSDLPASSWDVSSDYNKNISYSMTDQGESYLSLENTKKEETSSTRKKRTLQKSITENGK